MAGVNEALVQQVKNLKQSFGSKPQPELLIRIPNTNKQVEFEVQVKSKEFTSLCPLNLSQPDFAEIELLYCPLDWLVELKSLKFYYVSYRQTPVFHEQVPAMILDDLVKLLKPDWMVVVGKFTTRGGLDTTVTARYEAEGLPKGEL